MRNGGQRAQHDMGSPLLHRLAGTRVKPGMFWTALLLTAMGVGVLIGSDSLSVKHIVVIVAGWWIAIWLSRPGENRLRVALYAAVLLFAMGHRSIYVGRWTFFVPSELIFWLMFLLLLGRISLDHRLPSARVPRSLLFLTAWSLLALVLAPSLLSRWDDVLSQSKLWLVGLPVFLVTSSLITKPRHVRHIARLLILVSLYMSILAVVDYFLPAVTALLPAFFNPARRVFVTRDLVRSALAFWGSPTGVILINWGILIALSELAHAQEHSWRRLSAATVVFGSVTVYIVGQRATWIALPLGVSLLALLTRNRSHLVVAIVMPALLSILSLPEAFWSRFMSVLSVFPGRFSPVADTSLQQHIDRALWALDTLRAHPLFGLGYGGWLVHNEFLAFGAYLGLPALLAFASLFITVVGRLVQFRRQSSPTHEPRRYADLFLALTAVWFIDLSTQPVLGTPTKAIAFWFVLSMAWQIPNVDWGAYHNPDDGAVAQEPSTEVP